MTLHPVVIDNHEFYLPHTPHPSDGSRQSPVAEPSEEAGT